MNVFFEIAYFLLFLFNISFVLIIVIGSWSGVKIKAGNFFTYETYPLKRFFKKGRNYDQEE